MFQDSLGISILVCSSIRTKNLFECSGSTQAKFLWSLHKSCFQILGEVWRTFMFPNDVQKTLRKFLVFGASPNGVLVGLLKGVCIPVDWDWSSLLFQHATLWERIMLLFLSHWLCSCIALILKLNCIQLNSRNSRQVGYKLWHNARKILAGRSEFWRTKQSQSDWFEIADLKANNGK